MAVKAVNDTAGPNGLVPTLLMFGTFPRISSIFPPSPSIITRGEAIRKTMAEIHKLKAERQMINALTARNGPNVKNVLQLPLQSEVRVYREKRDWTGSYKLIAHNNDGTACIINVNGKITNFRVTSVRSYYRNEHTEIPSPVSDLSDDNSADEDCRPEPEKPTATIPRRRGRPPGSKNKPKIAIPVINITKEGWKAFITQKELENA
jgi:hypothetical protein